MKNHWNNDNNQEKANPLLSNLQQTLFWNGWIYMKEQTVHHIIFLSTYSFFSRSFFFHIPDVLKWFIKLLGDWGIMELEVNIFYLFILTFYNFLVSVIFQHSSCEMKENDINQYTKCLKNMNLLELTFRLTQKSNDSQLICNKFTQSHEYFQHCIAFYIDISPIFSFYLPFTFLPQIYFLFSKIFYNKFKFQSIL